MNDPPKNASWSPYRPPHKATARNNSLPHVHNRTAPQGQDNDKGKEMEMKPNPGSKEAIDKGCSCPVIDNGHGRGYMGGVKDKDGNTIFVYTVGCKVHGK